MKVKDLIKKLNKLDPNSTVVVSEEDGYFSSVNVNSRKLCKSLRLGDIFYRDSRKGKNKTVCVVLSSENDIEHLF